MKTILLLVAFCVIITTSAAQSSFLKFELSKAKPVNSMNPGNDIADNIFSYKQATLFSKSIAVCDLTETFNNPGPLTIFLPTDSVFKTPFKAKLDSLLTPDSKYDLIALITYHALPGNISAKDIAKEIRRQNGLAIFRTISGAALKARFDENRNILLIDETGGKSILQNTDIKQRNGLIHLVSAPLIPKFKAI